MHHIYKTRALVLGSRDLKEADKQLNLLTEDFGFLKVIAQGTRKMESKLRTSIQDFSFCDVAVVSGRAGWRLTNAKIVYSIYSKINDPKLAKSFAKSLSLIDRLVLGESDDLLFKIAIDFSEFIIDNQDKILHIDQINNIESVFVINILHRLGYVDDRDFEDLINKDVSMDLINSISDDKRKNMNKIINYAIRESGL